MKKHTDLYPYFKVIDTEEKAYWLGFLWADGCIYKNPEREEYALQLGLKEDDIEHIRKFLRFMNSEKKILLTKDKGCKITLYSKELVEDLINLGFKYRKSFQEELLHLEKIPSYLHKHFWRGCVDGDGWVLDKRKTEVGLCGNIRTIEEFKKFVEESIQYNSKGKIRPIKNIFLFRLTCLQARKLMSVLYRDSKIYLDRKFETASKHYDDLKKKSGGYENVLKGRKVLLD